MAGLSNAVRSYRLKLMRDFMREHEFDALAFTTPDWFEWASNNEVREQAWERPYVLVVSADGASFAVCSEHSRFQLSAGTKRNSLWIDGLSYYEELLEPRKGGWILPQWQEIVRQALAAAGLTGARIGVDAPSKHLSKLAAALPGLQILPAPDIGKLRLAKHAEELEAMRVAANLSDFAFDAYRDELKPGCVLTQVDWLIGSKLAAEGAQRLGADNFFTITSLATTSGATSAGPKGDGAPTGKTLENNSVAISTVVTRLNGVTMEVARPWLVGRPSDKAIAYLDCAFDAQRAAIDEAVAGRPVNGMHAAAQRVIDKAGCGDYFHFRAGHGIGVVMHDFPDDMAYNTRPLLERETYAIEPGLWVTGLGGFRYGDIVAVGAAAAEILTKTTTERARMTLS